MELADKGDMIYKINILDVKITCTVNKLIKHLPDETTSGYATKYWDHSKLMEDLHCIFNLKILPNLKTSIIGSSQVKTNSEYDKTKFTQIMHVQDTHTKDTIKYVRMDSPVCPHTLYKPTMNCAHKYNLCSVPCNLSKIISNILNCFIKCSQLCDMQCIKCNLTLLDPSTIVLSKLIPSLSTIH